MNLQIFLSILRPNGIQESVQKKYAIICPIKERKTKNDRFYGSASPNTKVRTMAPKYNIVSTTLVLSVIFLNCFFGVAKKHELYYNNCYPVIFSICPRLQSIANFVVSCFSTRTKTPKNDKSQPTMQQTTNPINLVFIEHLRLLLSSSSSPRAP